VNDQPRGSSSFHDHVKRNPFTGASISETEGSVSYELSNIISNGFRLTTTRLTF
jgi:hypothetical protein